MKMVLNLLVQVFLIAPLVLVILILAQFRSKGCPKNTLLSSLYVVLILFLMMVFLGLLWGYGNSHSVPFSSAVFLCPEQFFDLKHFFVPNKTLCEKPDYGTFEDLLEPVEEVNPAFVEENLIRQEILGCKTCVTECQIKKDLLAECKDLLRALRDLERLCILDVEQIAMLSFNDPIAGIDPKVTQASIDKIVNERILPRNDDILALEERIDFILELEGVSFFEELEARCRGCDMSESECSDKEELLLNKDQARKEV